MSEAVDWQVVDRALRGIAARRAALDSEEARWLREAEALQIWRPLGMVSALDYMERVLGYAPRSAQERLRVARALGELPKLDAALAQGRLSFTAVRELTRVATPANEAAWLEAATGKNLRQIEELVADHRLGDGPADPKDPEARTHVVRFELSASTYARLRQTRQALESERARSLSDDELVALLCEAALAGGDASEADDGRAKFQVAMTVCERCRQGWQEGAGVRLPVDASTVERAMCDAQHLGSLDGDAPGRAHQDVTPSVARFVRRRDSGRCRVPGCRSSRGLEIHHIVHREHGGGHEAGNLILLCSSCHTAHHDGILKIRGTAAELEVERVSKLDLAVRRARGAHVGASRAEIARVDQGRADGERLEPRRTENGHVDRGRVDGKRLEPGRTENGRVDQGRADGKRLEPERTENGRVDRGRIDGKRLEPERTENGRVDRERLEPERTENGRVDRGRVDGKRLEPGRTENGRVDRGRVDGKRLEPERTENGRVDRGRADRERLEPERTENGRVDRGRVDGKRLEPERTENGRVDQGRADGKRLEPGRTENGRVDQGRGGAERLKLGRSGGRKGAERLGDGDAERIELCGQVRRALVDAGWSSAVASGAVAAASAKLAIDGGGIAGGLERLLFEAFRACPRPRAS